LNVYVSGRQDWTPPKPLSHTSKSFFLWDTYDAVG